MQLESLPVENELNLGQVRYLVAIDEVLSVGDGCCSDRLIDLLDFIGRASDEAGTSVRYRLTSVRTQFLVGYMDSVHRKLPVTPLRHGNIGEVAGVMVRIRATKDDLSALCRIGVSVKQL